MKKIVVFLNIVVALVTFTSAKEYANPLQEKVNIDKLKNEKVQHSVSDWAYEKFGLKPYRPNYILPFEYTPHHYKRWTLQDRNYKHYEAELQISLKLAFKKNLFGFGETYYGAYSQRSFWQLYTNSSPFRESNYNPELFITFPVGSSKEYHGMKSFTFGYSHISNGQGNITETKNASKYPQLKNRSRSINKLYVQSIFQQKSLIIDLKLWVPVFDLDDNPDIIDYIGYGRIKLMYFYKKHLFTVMGRYNPFCNKGAAEVTYSHPSYLNGVYYFVKIFNGYAESLIDYDIRLTKYSIGFAFSR